MKVKPAQHEISSNISEQIEKREERTGKKNGWSHKMWERNRGKAARRGKNGNHQWRHETN